MRKMNRAPDELLLHPAIVKNWIKQPTHAIRYLYVGISLFIYLFFFFLNFIFIYFIFIAALKQHWCHLMILPSQLAMFFFLFGGGIFNALTPPTTSTANCKPFKHLHSLMHAHSTTNNRLQHVAHIIFFILHHVGHVSPSKNLHMTTQCKLCINASMIL